MQHFYYPTPWCTTPRRFYLKVHEEELREGSRGAHDFGDSGFGGFRVLDRSGFVFFFGGLSVDVFEYGAPLPESVDAFGLVKGLA